MYIPNQFPYYDDYDPNSGYQRILFRPGRAVQARELTQLQSILQNQVGTLGRHIFREGSLVFPSEPPIYIANLDYIKLDTTYNGVNSNDVLNALVNTKIQSNNNIIATVKAVKVSETGPSGNVDPPTIWVSYESKGDNGTDSTFANATVLTQYLGNVANIQIKTIASGASGQGTAIGLPENFIFIKDTFVKINKSIVVVDKYNRLVSNSVGFYAKEDIVTYADDSSLRDPAVLTEGAADSNFYALGADRYRITVTLQSRPLISSSESVNQDFFELIRVENSNPNWVRDDIIYDTLNSELAKRTYEESGDYVVNKFPIQLIEHRKTSNASVDGYYSPATGLSNSLVALIGSGLAYVRGYRIETKYDTPVTIYKPRDFVEVNDTFISVNYGNYIYITSVRGLPNLAGTFDTINIWDSYKPNRNASTGTGRKIGEAKVRHIELFSGTPGVSTAVYKLYLFDINMQAGQNFLRGAKSFTSSGAEAALFSANISPTLTLLSGRVSTTAGSKLITGSGTQFNLQLADPIDINATTYKDVITVRGTGDQNFIVDDVSGFNLLVTNTNAVYSNVNVPVFVHEAHIQESDKEIALTKLPYDYIKTVDANNTATTYVAKVYANATLSGNTVTFSIAGATNETWVVPTNERTILMIASGDLAGNIIPATGNVTVNANLKLLSVNVTSVAGATDSVISIITPKTKTTDRAARRTKTLTTNATYDITSSVEYNKSVIDLDKADGLRLVSVYLSSNTSVYNAVGAVNITSNYTFDNGQRPAYYDLAKIIRKSDIPPPTRPIRVTFDYFSHGDSGDYFSVDSYTDGGVSYKDVPVFTDKGTKYELSDYLDLRPVKGSSGFSAVPDFISSESNFLTDLEYYQAWNALISLDNLGKMNVRYGSGAQLGLAKDPEIPPREMPLYVIRMKPYVKNIITDVSVESLTSIRYTMKDIGKLERRITNLEYYTTLTLLEKQTESLQIKDEYGLDRFKNGFIVDNFSGFSVADVDSQVSIDFRTNELRPRYSMKTF